MAIVEQVILRCPLSCVEAIVVCTIPYYLSFSRVSVRVRGPSNPPSVSNSQGRNSHDRYVSYIGPLCHVIGQLFYPGLPIASYFVKVQPSHSSFGRELDSHEGARENTRRWSYRNSSHRVSI